MRLLVFKVVFVVGLWGLSGGLGVAAQHASPPPSQTQSSVQARATVPVVALPGVNGDSLRAAARQDSDRIGPYRYGRVLDTHITPTEDGKWERLPSGDWLWRVRVRSPDARSLSLGFAPFGLPEGARLFMHEGNGETVRGPYTAEDATNGEHRTPLVRSEEVVVELVVPDGRRAALNLVLASVVHGYRSMHPSGSNGNLSKSGTCNLDVACNEADPWRRPVRAAGLYSFESDGSTFTCSGSLVNNTAEDERPFFLTAEHCISSAAEASTMTFYWNYQNSTCREQGTSENGALTADDRSEQTSSGAILRVRYGNWHVDESISGKPDLALVEVDDTIPQTYDLFFSGWSRGGAATGEAATIHHPNGDGKRISFDQQPTDVTAYGGTAGSGDTHLRVGNWEVGTTEPGSSGSPLYDANQHVVGVLSGGLAGCDGGGVDDNNEPDWYGRIAPGFSNGDYPETNPSTLADWLDPANTGVQRLDGRPQQDQPVMGPPTGLTATTTPERIRLEWSVPDTVEAAAYRLYRSQAPIDSTIVTRSVYTPLQRLPAGTTTFVDSTAVPDISYHYRIAAIDSAAYEGAFSNEATATITVPSVHLADGRDGVGYDASAPTPETDRNPVGRFVLQPDASGVELDSVAIATDGTPSGITGAELWRSSDSTFEAGDDTRLAVDNSGRPIRFGNVSASLPTDSTYVFLTVDLSADASGDYAPVLRDETTLTLSEGALVTVNGASTRTFSDAYLSSASTPLPVELVTFNATADANAVRLTWKTASETNNAIFHVQRRQSGALKPNEQAPSDAWHTVGSREGAGTTTEPQRYRFSDTALPAEADTLVYRLKQVDHDGSVQYSDPRTVERSVDAVTLSAPVPNPARRQATVRYTLPAPQSVTLRLYDVLGRPVKTIVEERQAGRTRTTLDVTGLGSGVYLLRLRTDGAVRTQKLTVVR